jgi:hypothetical protein
LPQTADLPLRILIHLGAKRERMLFLSLLNIPVPDSPGSGIKRKEVD